MVRNNHSKDNRKKLDELLRTDELLVKQDCLAKVLAYARFMANIENSIVVVSDMADGKSHIVAGGFVHNLELGDYQQENSIWESRILSLMSADEQEEKYLCRVSLLPLFEAFT